MILVLHATWTLQDLTSEQLIFASVCYRLSIICWLGLILRELLRLGTPLVGVWGELGGWNFHLTIQIASPRLPKRPFRPGADSPVCGCEASCDSIDVISDRPGFHRASNKK